MVRRGVVPVVPAVGDIVTARITKINPRLASADILCVGQQPVQQRYSGIIRVQVWLGWPQSLLPASSMFGPRALCLWAVRPPACQLAGRLRQCMPPSLALRAMPWRCWLLWPAAWPCCCGCCGGGGDACVPLRQSCSVPRFGLLPTLCPGAGRAGHRDRQGADPGLLPPGGHREGGGHLTWRRTLLLPQVGQRGHSPWALLHSRGGRHVMPECRRASAADSTALCLT